MGDPNRQPSESLESLTVRVLEAFANGQWLIRTTPAAHSVRASVQLASRAECMLMGVSEGGSLEFALSNGYGFLSFNNDWDVDGTVRPLVETAAAAFRNFCRNRFSLRDGRLVARKYMDIEEVEIEGVRLHRTLPTPDEWLTAGGRLR